MFKAWRYRKQLDHVKDKFLTGLIDEEVLQLSLDMGYAVTSGSAVLFNNDEHVPKALYGYTILLYILGNYGVVLNADGNREELELGLRVYCQSRNKTIIELLDQIVIKDIKEIEEMPVLVRTMVDNIKSDSSINLEDSKYHHITKTLLDHGFNTNHYDLYRHVYNVFVRDEYSDEIMTSIGVLKDKNFFINEQEYEKLMADIDHKPWVHFQINVNPDEVDDWEFVVDYNSYFVDNVIVKHKIPTIDADGDEIPREDVEETAIDAWVTRNFAKLVASSITDEGGEYFKPQATGTPEATIVEELEVPKQQDGQSDEDFQHLVDEIKKRRSMS